MTEPLSVVVPTRDRPALLAQCLVSVRAALEAGDEIIVVDSASRDASAKQVAADHDARYVRAERPGASRARNTGWRDAEYPLVGFVDDDVTVAPGWARAVKDAFDADRAPAFVTGRVVPPPHQDRVDYPVALYDHPEAFDLVPGTPRPYGISGNFAARREALERIGGFDELLGPGARFRGGGDDLDLFDRLLTSGARGRFEPAVLAYHDQWRRKWERLVLDFDYGIGAGARLAKQVRMDRRFARAIAKEIFWRWGVRDLAACLRNRYEYGALAALFRLAGMVRGTITAATVPVRAGHFAPRGES